MVTSKDGGYLDRGLVGYVLRNGRCLYLAQVCLCQNALHHRGVRRQHQVVLIHTHRVVAFLLQHTYHAERYGVESHNLAHGIGSVREEIVNYSLSEDANLRTRLQLLVGEELSIANAQLSNAQIFLVHAIDGRLRVVIAIDKLAAGAHHRTDGLDVGALVLQSLIVGELKGLHGRRVLSHATSHVGSRMHHNHVGAHLCDVGLNAPLGSLSNGQHRDDRCHTNDDAQCREERAHLIGENGSEGYFK